MCHLRHFLAGLSKIERVFLAKNSFSAISTGLVALRQQPKHYNQRILHKAITIIRRAAQSPYGDVGVDSINATPKRA